MPVVMAEFTIATGIIQVAGAGIALTKALYFRATTSAAGEQTEFIGKDITLYCRVLKTLKNQITAGALHVAHGIHEESHSLFRKIRKLLPSAGGSDGRLSLKDKIL